MSQDDYGHGLLEGAQRQYIADRAAAFGAIRRAAAIARNYDAAAERIAATSEDPEKDRRDWREGGIGMIDGYLFNVSGSSVGERESAAFAVRYAIRAAIRSPKA